MSESTIKILLVEDEPNIAEGIIFNLSAEGYQVTHCDSAEDALTRPTSAYDLLVLDVMLPGISGFELCRRLRNIGAELPILIVSAKGGEEDRVTGLSAGADDYLSKPFSLREFLLRVKALLRRSRNSRTTPRAYVFGQNRIELAERRAQTPRGEQELTELEVRMLELFFRHEGRILSRSELLQKVWGMSPDTETRTLDNFVVRLRKYFEADPAHPQHFQTVRGRGYRFVRN
jgi:DNA-binding response OmpR family regulator